MKKTIYITAFTFLGVLLQFLLHAWVEIWYTNLLLKDFAAYGFGLSWQTWFAIHHILSILLLIAGLIFGYKSGQYWWKQIYVLKRYKWKK